MALVGHVGVAAAIDHRHAFEDGPPGAFATVVQVRDRAFGEGTPGDKVTANAERGGRSDGDTVANLPPRHHSIELDDHVTGHPVTGQPSPGRLGHAHDVEASLAHDPDSDIRSDH